MKTVLKLTYSFVLVMLFFSCSETQFEDVNGEQMKAELGLKAELGYFVFESKDEMLKVSNKIFANV